MKYDCYRCGERLNPDGSKPEHIEGVYYVESQTETNPLEVDVPIGLAHTEETKRVRDSMIGNGHSIERANGAIARNDPQMLPVPSDISGSIPDRWKTEPNENVGPIRSRIRDVLGRSKDEIPVDIPQSDLRRIGKVEPHIANSDPDVITVVIERQIEEHKANIMVCKECLKPSDTIHWKGEEK